VTRDDLYHEALLRLSRSAAGAGRLDAPDGTGSAENPLCGDEVTIDVKVRNGRIVALGHRVRGCVLCEAAASVVGAAAPGLSAAEAGEARARAAAMLAAGAPPPGGAWDGLAAFEPVRAVRGRHGCVLLPFDALLRAMEEAGL
jgi:nitrogen fixation NifU-like protein